MRGARGACALALLAALSCRSGEGGAAVALALEPAPSTYASVIAPIFQARCVACHGPEQVKGKLRLDSPAAILAGGSSGPALVPGAPDESELMLRLGLPLSDSDHMPPKSKPQPSRAELLALRAWIAAGAPFEGLAEGVVAPEAPVSDDEPGLPPAPPAAIEALRSELVHVQELATGSPALWIDFAAVAERIDDRQLARLLGPVRLQVAHLALARSAITDASAQLLASCTHLRRLDLRDTRVGDGTVAALAPLARLEELVLARTRVSASSVEILAGMAPLRSVHVWGAGLDAAAVAALRERARGLRVEAGDTPDAAVAQTEESVTFTSDAPIPGLAPLGTPGAPVNVLCPVTQSPVNPKHVLEHEGQRVAFCCGNCPAAFRADPAKYPIPRP